VDNPQKRQALGSVGLFVQVENIRNFVRLEDGVTAVHFSKQFLEFLNCFVLVVDNTTLQMW
jgi:hypothetical protein